MWDAFIASQVVDGALEIALGWSIVLLRGLGRGDERVPPALPARARLGDPLPALRAAALHLCAVRIPDDHLPPGRLPFSENHLVAHRRRGPGRDRPRADRFPAAALGGLQLRLDARPRRSGRLCRSNECHGSSALQLCPPAPPARPPPGVARLRAGLHDPLRARRPRGEALVGAGGARGSLPRQDFRPQLCHGADSLRARRDPGPQRDPARAEPRQLRGRFLPAGHGARLQAAARRDEPANPVPGHAEGHARSNRRGGGYRADRKHRRWCRGWRTWTWPRITTRRS